MMLMSGRCGFALKEEMRFSGDIREVTPGKRSSKNAGNDVGSLSRVAKWPDGKKRVQVKDPSF
jgi:hypothetical protein